MNKIIKFLERRKENVMFEIEDITELLKLDLDRWASMLYETELEKYKEELNEINECLKLLIERSNNE